eukprot:TRINITY_DN14642_c0_g1_i2.p1 TRINITY_DN14642_c0_g1~~TRINITY_DN14642_c0_g1_i2.p1  ORF type:complete len:419 (+),score=65.04 TRINITY_DN14642_c0_g1_i2:112-1368(+)
MSIIIAYKMNSCTNHPGQKLRKLCKNPECWIRVCSKCASELHKGHRVVEVSALLNEVKGVKEKFIAARKSERSKVKVLTDELASLDLQLNDIKRKQKEEDKTDTGDIKTEGNESSFKQIQSKLLELKEEVNKHYSACNEEMTRIADLAKEVIAKGLDEDYKTFFEICEEGSANTVNIKEYKKSIEIVKEDIKLLYFQHSASPNNGKESVHGSMRRKDSASRNRVKGDLKANASAGKRINERKNYIRSTSPPKLHARVRPYQTKEMSGRKSPKSARRESSVITKSPTTRSITTRNPNVYKPTPAASKRNTSLIVKPKERTTYESTGVNTELNATHDVLMKMVESKSEEYELQCKIKVEAFANVVGDVVIKNWIQERKKFCKFSRCRRLHLCKTYHDLQCNKRHWEEKIKEQKQFGCGLC